MMKTIARTLIILLTAGLISLGWYASSTTSSTQTSMPDQPAEFVAADDVAEAGTDTTGLTAPPRPDGGEQSFSVSRVLSGTAVIIGQTAIVIALVVLVRKLGNWLSTSYFRKSKIHGKLNAPPQPN